MWVKGNAGDKDILVNTDHVSIIYPTEHAVRVDGIELTLSKELFGELLKKMFPTRKEVAKENVELAEFLNQLHTLTGGKAKAILTPQREKKLTTLLKSFDKEQLITAATNIGKDEWLQGENDNHKRYGDVDYLLRPDKAAKWAEVNPADKKRKMF